MVRKFSDLVKQSEGFKGFSSGVYTSDDYTMIPINQICCRSINKYVDKQDVAESLKNSIKKLGLIEPIIVIEIESYKKLLDSSDSEYDYLTQMQGKGCNYFISSGHRRFKAFISLALKRDMYPGAQIDYLYSDEVKKMMDDYLENKIDLSLISNKPEQRFYEIPCKIEKKLLDNENEFYNQSNSTQRELTNYEVIINTIDTLEKNGLMDEFKQHAVDKVIDGLSTRYLSKWINDYVKEGILKKEQTKNLEDDEKKRQLLKTVPFEYVGKTKNIIASDIEKQILNDSGRSVPASKIRETMTMLDQIEQMKVNTGYDIMSLVYSGEMNFKDVRELASFADKIAGQKGKEEVKNIIFDPINEARKKNLELGRLKDTDPDKYGKKEYIKISEISSKGVKALKEIFSEKKPSSKKLSYTNSELIEFIYAIDRGEITAKDVIKKIEDLNKK